MLWAGVAQAQETCVGDQCSPPGSIYRYIADLYVSGTVSAGKILLATNLFEYTVATRAELKAIVTPTGTAPFPTLVAQQLGYARSGDGGAASYTWSSSACSLNSGAGDNGSQIKPTVGNGCWLADPVAALNLKVYGATGDGVSSDQTALTNWLAYCVAAGKPCYAPAGTWVATATLTANTLNYVEIYGQGINSTKFKMNNSGPTTLFNITAASLVIGNTNLHDFEIVQPTNNNPGSTGIILTNRMRAIVERVRIDNNYRGIDLVTSYAAQILYSDFRNNSAEAIKFESSGGNSATNALVFRSYFLSNAFAGTYAINLLGGQDTAIIYNDIEGNWGGIGLTGGSLVAPLISGNHFESQQTLGDIDFLSGGPIVQSAKIVGNYIQNGPTATWTYAADISMTENVLENTTINMGTGITTPWICRNAELFSGVSTGNDNFLPAQANYCPTAMVGAPNSCGTTPSTAASSNDVKGTFTVGTGAPAACTISFNRDHGTAPVAFNITPGVGTAGVIAYPTSLTSTGFTLAFVGGAGAGTYSWQATWP